MAEGRRANFLYICGVCVCACICVHVCMYIFSCTCLFVRRRPEADLGSLPPFSFLREEPTELGADLKPSGSLWLPTYSSALPSVGATQLLCPGFILEISIQTQVFMSAEQQELRPLDVSLTD